jgi:hypothetical protein
MRLVAAAAVLGLASTTALAEPVLATELIRQHRRGLRYDQIARPLDTRDRRI